MTISLIIHSASQLVTVAGARAGAGNQNLPRYPVTIDSSDGALSEKSF